MGKPYLVAAVGALLIASVASQTENGFVETCENGALFRFCGLLTPGLDPCVTGILQFGVDAFARGLQVLGFPSIDPLTVKSVTLESLEGGSCDLSNLKVTGLNRILAQDFQRVVYTNTSMFKFAFLIPDMVMNISSYEMKRGFVDDNDFNQGTATISIHEPKVDFEMYAGSDIGGNGDSYLKPLNVTSSLTSAGEVTVNFSGLSPEQNYRLNQRPRDMLYILQISLGSIMSKITEAFTVCLYKYMPPRKVYATQVGWVQFCVNEQNYIDRKAATDIVCDFSY